MYDIRDTISYIPTFETVKAGHFIPFVTTEGPTMVGAEGDIFKFQTFQDVCIMNFWVVWDIYWISKLPILLLLWRENKQLTRPKAKNMQDYVKAFSTIRYSTWIEADHFF